MENSFGQKVYIYITHILLMLLSSSVIFFLTIKKGKCFEMTAWPENKILKRNWEEREIFAGFFSDADWFSFTFPGASGPALFGCWTFYVQHTDNLELFPFNSEACKWWKDYIFSRSNLRVLWIKKKCV